MFNISPFVAALSLLLVHATGLAATIADPIDSTSQDITSIYASYDNTNIYLAATFAPLTFVRGSLGMVFGLDTDLDAGTGASSPSIFPLGAEYTLYFNALSPSLAQRFQLNKVGTPGIRAYITPTFSGSEVQLTVARSFVNNSSVFNFGLASGNATVSTSFQITDFASQVLSGPSDFGTPSWAVTAVPETSTSLLALLGLGVLSASFAKKRGLTSRPS